MTFASQRDDFLDEQCVCFSLRHLKTSTHFVLIEAIPEIQGVEVNPY